jgi:hypothetical protein
MDGSSSGNAETGPGPGGISAFEGQIFVSPPKEGLLFDARTAGR